MFLPKLILNKIGLIQSSVNGTEGVALYDIKRWLTNAAEHTKAVLKKDLQMKLLKAKVISKLDLKKVEKTFSGWGVKNYEKRRYIQKAALDLIKTK